MDNSKRALLKSITLLALLSPMAKAKSSMLNIHSDAVDSQSTFRFIYNNASYRREFYDFLVNVFHLYPEDEMHDLITLLSNKLPNDKDIYLQMQDEIPIIKPFLSELYYAIPALNKQKKIMASQTAKLLDVNKNYNGYLELGTTGRYIDALEENLKINGDRFFMSEFDATYSPVDMVDRGQIIKAGEYINLNNYTPTISNTIANNSIDLVTVYIGFHHCPVDLREEFITSIRDTMTLGASLVIRDHDVHDKKMLNMVALAHDVFNVGTNMSWDYNHNELRNFYSLKKLDEVLSQFGFKSQGQSLLQKGDPTLNTLMLYKKV